MKEIKVIDKVLTKHPKLKMNKSLKFYIREYIDNNGSGKIRYRQDKNIEEINGIFHKWMRVNIVDRAISKYGQTAFIGLEVFLATEVELTEDAFNGGTMTIGLVVDNSCIFTDDFNNNDVLFFLIINMFIIYTIRNNREAQVKK